MVEKWYKSPVPVYSFAAMWVIYSCFFPLYRMWHFVVCAALSVAVYFVFSKLFPGVRIMEQPAAKKTGDDELDELLDQGNEAIAEFCRLNSAIGDISMSENIIKLEVVTQKILDFIRENPKRLSDIKRFMNYYLPTTLKLLKTYERLKSQGVSGENIDGTMIKIEKTLGTISTAFQSQLDKLFADDAFDVGADISVMETMIAKEGLKNSDF